MSLLRRVVGWVVGTPVTYWAGVKVNHWIGDAELCVLAHYNDDRVVSLLKRLRSEDAVLFKPSELLMLHSFARYASRLPGDFVEVGVYRGTSAQVIADAIAVSGRARTLWLFDTFVGIPHAADQDGLFWEGQFQSPPRKQRSNLDVVRDRLASFDDVRLCPGVFPSESASVLHGRRVAFVHLDVDVYESTLQALQALYPLLVSGGILLIHDYGQAWGVKSAVNEFFAERPEQVVELPMSQCLIIKGGQPLSQQP